MIGKVQPLGDVDTVEKLNSMIEFMHAKGYVHRKREYVLSAATPAMALTHELEEFCEFQAAAIAFDGMKISDQNKGKYDAMLEEAADRLACGLHANMVVGLKLAEIVKRAAEKMQDIFIAPDQWKE